MQTFQQVVKNCGNFSAEVLPGMIAYGRETKKGRGKLEASAELPQGDGYATKEADIQLGGFLYIHATQEAAHQGQSLSRLTVPEKQKLVLRLCQDHLTRYGAAGPESHTKWMKRTESFSKYHNITLPAKGDRESHYDYFRRLRQWTSKRPENWPELRKAVGTHLVFSPEPKLWASLRDAGIDERSFLRSVLTSTMKEFSDWRREMHGAGHSLGWIAGSHVRTDGADRHPHIHVVVLKRDESGKEVDWSVSSLKGHKTREHEPDPLRTIKRLFEKNVEKAYERFTGKELSNSSARDYQDRPKPPLRRLARGLRTAAWTLRRSSICHPRTELGAMIRLMSQIQRSRQTLPLRSQKSPSHQPGF